MFHQHIHKSVEVYVDDILIKSNQAKDHLELLEEVFHILKKCNLRLKPQKCDFGFTSKNYLVSCLEKVY